MKAKIILALILLSVTIANAQWQQCNNGTCNYTQKCFLESAGTLFSTGGCISVDSGLTWTLPATGVFGLSMAKNSTGIFIGSDTAIYFSNNNGSSWNSIFNTGPLNFVYDIALLHDTAFFATPGSGILMTPDNGMNWYQPVNGLPNDSILTIVAKGNILFVGLFSNGIYKSSDAGLHWYPATIGLPTISYVCSIAVDGNNLIATTFDGIYISPNNGITWTQTIPVVPNIRKIIKIGNVLLAGGFTPTGLEGVYRSFDHGATWSFFNTGLPTGCANGVGGLYATANYVYCGIEAACGGSIYRINRNTLVTSIIENNNKIECSVSPDPFSSELKIASTIETSLDVFIYDITSRKILQQSFTKSTTLSTDKFSKGIYIYEVRNGNEIIKSGKLIKE